MKNFLMAMFFIMASVGSVSAETFYEKQTGNWFVFGDYGDEELTPACVISYSWQDGSEFQLIYDLQLRVLDIWLENYDWNISDPAGNTYNLDIVIVGAGNDLTTGELTYRLEDKNSIYIESIEPIAKFLEDFSRMNELRFIMPGTIMNAYLSLDGSRGATNLLLECIEKGVDLNLNRPQKNKFQDL